MNSVFVPARCPEDWRCLLARPDRHWRDGYSAKLLAQSWQQADGFPESVRRVLVSSPIDALANLEMLAAFPEYKVPLPGGRRASQSDIFVLAKSSCGLVSMTVEGKMHESFGTTVVEWSTNASAGKRKRLAYVCDILGLAVPDVQPLPYQLLHRTASALILAEKFCAPVATMLVHSFSPDDEGFNEFTSFATVMDAQAQLGLITEARSVGGRRVLLGWVSDVVPQRGELDVTAKGA